MSIAKKYNKKHTITFFFLFFLLNQFSHITPKIQEIRELPIAIVMPSYNNKEYYKKNLDSVFMQNYDNYRIIYINDASTDGTGELVQEYIKQKGQEHRVTLVNNKENRGAMANHYMAVHMCQDNEIVAHMDADDWFKHKNVLSIVNKAYQDKNIWLTYGQFERLLYEKDKKTTHRVKGQCRPVHQSIIQRNAYREASWVTSSLRTFRAGLFKQIKLKDFLSDGKFYDATCDLGMMFPMLELSGGKFKFIDEIVYVYNRLNPLNDHNLRLFRQAHLGNVIKAKKKYKPLQTNGLPSHNIPKNAKADLIILSEKHPEYLYAIVESAYGYTTGIENIFILHTSITKETKEFYNFIRKDFPYIKFAEANSQNFKETLENTLEASPNKHILLAKDTVLLKDFVNISNCIRLLEQIYAHGFYLSLGQNITKNKDLVKNQKTPVHTELEHNIFFWQFAYGQQEWRKPNNLLMTLYKKEDILNLIQPINYSSQKELEQSWNFQEFDLENTGLFFKTSKLVSLEKDTQNLLEKFKNKLKIDIKPLFFVKNSYIKEKIDLTFEEQA